MACIQDISLLMRELLKVPKDYTPTAMEISKYIKSRYNPDSNIGKPPMGARGYSSWQRGMGTKREDVVAPPPQKPSRVISTKSSKQQVGGKRLSFSTVHSNTPKKHQINKNEHAVLKRNEVKTAVKPVPLNRTYYHRGSVDAKTLKKPQTAPSINVAPKAPQGHHRSFWSWQTTKDQIRRSMSEIMTTPPTKTKLSVLADQHRLDPNQEVALERQRKEMIREMLGPGANRTEPLRTREVIQKLLEDNKLQIQRQEIAKLTKLARAKVLEARKTAREKHLKKREMEFAS